MVSGHSADVWSRQHEFRIDASVGVPPDAFTETGQDWGLPYRWDAMRHGRLRVAAAARPPLRRSVRRLPRRSPRRLLSHLRARERDGRTATSRPPTSRRRRRRANADALLRESGAASSPKTSASSPTSSGSRWRGEGARLKVLRWERDWAHAGQPFRSLHVPRSIGGDQRHARHRDAGEWWDRADRRERHRCAATSSAREAAVRSPTSPSTIAYAMRCYRVFRAGSDIVIVPLQDVFGWRDRINVPAGRDDENWTWRLPWPVEKMGGRARRDGARRLPGVAGGAGGAEARGPGLAAVWSIHTECKTAARPHPHSFFKQQC